jgi:hypothetical protein
MEAKYSFTELAYEFTMDDEPTENKAKYYEEDDKQKLEDNLLFPDQLPEDIRAEDDYFLHISLPVFT